MPTDPEKIPEQYRVSCPVCKQPLVTDPNNWDLRYKDGVVTHARCLR